MDDMHSGLRRMPLLGAILVLLLVLAGASLYYAAQNRAAGGAVSQQVEMLARAAAEMPGAAYAARGGDAAAFDRLNALGDQARAAFNRLPQDIQPASFEALSGAAEAVAASRQDVLTAGAAAAAVANSALTIQGLLSEFSANANSATRASLDQASALAGRVAVSASTLAAGVPDPVSVSRLLSDDEMRLGQLVLALGGAAPTAGVAALSQAGREAQIDTLEQTYRALSDSALTLIASADALEGTTEGVAAVAARAGDLTTALARMPNSASGSLGPIKLNSPWLPLGLVAAALLVALALAAMTFSGEDSRRTAELQRGQNERNQAAILRLLDELGSLADGDLTVQATVTEDITGAIADSINYAIEALRELVTTINETGIRIDAAARQTQATAGHLAQASETQSKQVADATESVARMAASVEAVSGDAERSADVARHSVDVAHKGGEAVRRTIEGMNTIRETIQDTSKRIKRLGESSQEIGNIIELINDIAEQTNILALNASIQASMAGEAGRGFAVVADEVQRLAERSANATKQIEVLVKTIQSDTNEAVISMERSTTDVVGGALLAENAGAALDEIESVSNQIANLVQNISGTAREQSTAATDITRNMGVLREVSSQTAEATGATSDSIGKLAELAAQLRSSVSGFRLPAAPAGSRSGKSGKKKSGVGAETRSAKA
ncbi:MAG: methyl-accepting chemotaxis protein [Gammaproteobacteria bacterium]